LIDQIEEGKKELASRDACLVQLQAKMQRFLGTSKALVTEEALYSSASMKTITGQL